MLSHPGQGFELLLSDVEFTENGTSEVERLAVGRRIMTELGLLRRVSHYLFENYEVCSV